MKLDAIRARIADALFDRWLADAGLTPSMWASLADGIPEAWAAEVEREFGVPRSDWPALLHGELTLTKRLPKSRVKPEMNKDHKLSIAKGAAGKDKFRRKCQEAGMSQNDVARKLGISKGRLAQYRNGEPIPAARAAAVKKLIGWPDDAAHWPGGIS